MNNRTPWVVQSRSMSDGALVIKDADNNEVCCLVEKSDREYGKKDTERQILGEWIVNCMNSHSGLVDALEKYFDEMEITDHEQRDMKGFEEKALYALYKAQGG